MSSNNMRTSLSRVRGFGAAGGGTHHFWVQRITALANIPLTLFFIWVLAHNVRSPHADITAFIASPYIATPLLLLVLSLCWHMRLGLQMVIEDYISSPALKWSALIFNQFFSISVAVLSALSLIRIMVSG